MSAKAKGSKRQKIALQFVPICDSTQQYMHACGYNPLLELTVSLTKRASSVHHHLCTKWSQAQVSQDVYVMVPTHPGSAQYAYLDLATETPLSAVLGSWLGFQQLQLLYGFRKHAPQQACAKEVHEEGHFLQDLGIGLETCMAVLNPSTPGQHDNAPKPKATNHSESGHVDCQNEADVQSFLLPEGTNTLLAAAAAVLGPLCATNMGGEGQLKNTPISTPQKAVRDETRPFLFEDSLPSFGALFPDDSPRALILDNLSLLYSPSAALTNHSVHSAKGQRRSQHKDASGNAAQSIARRNLAISSPFKAAARATDSNVPRTETVKRIADLDKENEIKSPFAAIIAMHNASPKSVDSKILVAEHSQQRYVSPSNDASKPVLHSTAGSSSSSVTKRRQTPLSQEAKKRKRIRPTFVGSLDSATLQANRNDSFVRC